MFERIELYVNTNAQQVKVLERGSNLPIENVTIYNDSKFNLI